MCPAWGAYQDKYTVLRPGACPSWSHCARLWWIYDVATGLRLSVLALIIPGRRLGAKKFAVSGT